MEQSIQTAASNGERIAQRQLDRDVARKIGEAKMRTRLKEMAKKEAEAEIVKKREEGEKAVAEELEKERKEMAKAKAKKVEDADNAKKEAEVKKEESR